MIPHDQIRCGVDFNGYSEYSVGHLSQFNDRSSKRSFFKTATTEINYAHILGFDIKDQEDLDNPIIPLQEAQLIPNTDFIDDPRTQEQHIVSYDNINAIGYQSSTYNPFQYASKSKPKYENPRQDYEGMYPQQRQRSIDNYGDNRVESHPRYE